MLKKNIKWLKIAVVNMVIALILSGCGMQDLAEQVATQIKERETASIGGRKCMETAKKTVAYYENMIGIYDETDFVEWNDVTVSEIVAQLLDMDASEITYGDLQLITTLEIDSENQNYDSIKSFEDLKYMSQLTCLEIYGAYLELETTDFSPIGELVALEQLTLDSVEIGDVSFIGELTKLTELYVMDCGLSDISFVENLALLEQVSFYGNYLMDITPLAGHEYLYEISLANNPYLSDIAPLAQLPALQEAGLHYCMIEDISPLAQMSQLELLNLSGNPISDLGALSQMTQLKKLALEECGISDVSALASLSNLNELYLEGNQIADITPLAGMTNLSVLRIPDNAISDFTPLENMGGLFQLYIYGNPIETIPENALKVPYLDIGYYYTWHRNKSDEMMQEEKSIAEELLAEYWPEEDGYAADMISGNLNGDSYEDIVILVESDYSYARNYYVFYGAGNGEFAEAGMISMSEAYLEVTENDPYYGMIIVNQTLILSYLGTGEYGWLDNMFYQYIDGEWTVTRLTGVNFCTYYTGADCYEYDFLNNTSTFSAYVQEEYCMKRLLLQEGDSNKLYNKTLHCYPELDPYYDFYCYRNLVEGADEGLEAILQQEFAEYEQKALEYTPETRENYSRLTGTWVPEYYYEADGGQLYYATTYANADYEVIQVFAYRKDGEKIYYKYNTTTKEVVTEDSSLYN